MDEGSGLYFESEAQRRIVETICAHPSGDVFMPYLETITGQTREELACELCRLEAKGFIEEDTSANPNGLAPFILPYVCTPKGRMVMRVIQNQML